MAHSETTPEEIVDFWFGTPARTEQELLGKFRRWFVVGAALDETIRTRFGHIVQAALRGDLDSWRATNDGALALVLALDQFPRHIHRDSAAGFEGDRQARELALELVNTGRFASYTLEARVFLIAPLIHSEDAELQDLAVTLTEQVWRDAPPELQPAYAAGIEQTRKYQAIIKRFGRFPHRNSILGRTSTAAELEFLANDPALRPPARLAEQGTRS